MYDEEAKRPLAPIEADHVRSLNLVQALRRDRRPSASSTWCAISGKFGTSRYFDEACGAGTIGRTSPLCVRLPPTGSTRRSHDLPEGSEVSLDAGGRPTLHRLGRHENAFAAVDQDKVCGSIPEMYLDRDSDYIKQRIKNAVVEIGTEEHSYCFMPRDGVLMGTAEGPALFKRYFLAHRQGMDQDALRQSLHYPRPFKDRRHIDISISVFADDIAKRGEDLPTIEAYDQDIKKLFLSFSMGYEDDEKLVQLGDSPGRRTHGYEGTLKRGRAPAAGLERELSAWMAALLRDSGRDRALSTLGRLRAAPTP